MQIAVILYGQPKCDFYIDELKKEDTLKISVVFHINRAEITEEILIYKNEFEKYCGLINTDSIKNVSIELTSSNINELKLFELGIRKQKLASTVPLIMHSLAEYQISYNQGSVSYYTKHEFFSLCKELFPD